jgi:hypothetical protein
MQCLESIADITLIVYKSPSLQTLPMMSANFREGHAELEAASSNIVSTVTMPLDNQSYLYQIEVRLPIVSRSARDEPVPARPVLGRRAEEGRRRAEGGRGLKHGDMSKVSSRRIAQPTSYPHSDILRAGAVFLLSGLHRLLLRQRLQCKQPLPGALRPRGVHPALERGRVGGRRRRRRGEGHDAHSRNESTRIGWRRTPACPSSTCPPRSRSSRM